MKTMENKIMSIDDITELLDSERVSKERFWQAAMGGDMAPLPESDVLHIVADVQSDDRS
jgi:hypothetical protein